MAVYVIGKARNECAFRRPCGFKIGSKVNSLTGAARMGTAQHPLDTVDNCNAKGLFHEFYDKITNHLISLYRSLCRDRWHEARIREG